MFGSLWFPAMTSGSSGASAFDPGDVSGLLGAWHFDDAVLDGSNVQTAIAKFGATASDASAVGELRPAHIASWRNGHAAMQGTSGGGLVLLSTLTAALVQPCTVYIVGTSPTTNQSYYTSCSNNSIVAREQGTTGNPGLNAGANAFAASATPRSTPFIGRFSFNDADSSVLIEPHGGAVISATGLNPGSNDGNGTFQLGGFGSLTSNAMLAMVLVYSGAPDDTELLPYLREWGDITAA